MSNASDMFLWIGIGVALFLVILMFCACGSSSEKPESYKEPSLPLISAICVTRKRVNYLKRALKCFQQQTYPNREFVIVYDEDDNETEDFIKANFSGQRWLRAVVNREKGLKLGSLRNLGIVKARGEYIVQFDDDDEYSPHRLTEQYNAIQTNGNSKACLLNRWYIVDELTGKMYMSPARTWEGSIMAPKSLMLQYPYPDQSRAEDTAVIVKLQQNGLLVLIDRPDLYVYHLHESNTWERSHGLSLIRDCEEIPTRFEWQE